MKAQVAGGVVIYHGIEIRIRLEGKYIVNPDTDCWIWKGKPSEGGYGRYKINNKQLRTSIGAHVASYLMHHGSIADGLVIDHLCRVRNCINPKHLEAVTQKENVRRSNLVRCRPRSIKGSHCRKGHPFDSENTMPRKNGHRRCRICHNAGNRRRWGN